MTRYFAFLKAINVGGHVLTMARLRDIARGLGFADAETFIASGNVTFTGGARGPRGIESRLAEGLGGALGYAVPVFVRTASELGGIAEGLPFTTRELATAVVVNIGFLSRPLEPTAVARMREYDTESDHFRTAGREFYWLSRTKQSESPFFKVKFEKTFGADVTFRRLTTVMRLLAKYTP